MHKMDAHRGETERVRRIYDALASRYDRVIAWSERLFFGDGRAWACAQAHGDVLEVAIGTGRDLPYYPAETRLTGIDVSPAMLAVARRRAADLHRAIDLRLGDAQTLEFSDASFDVVVFTLALCTIPDASAAVAEAARVLRPGGRLVLLEHVRSPRRAVRAIQRVLEPITVRFQAGHLLREPRDDVVAASLRVEWLARSRWGVVERLAARKVARGDL